MDIEVTQPHPNPAPNSHYRKVDLQSKADLTYLQQNLAKSAREKLDLHFPPLNPSAAPATFISLGDPNVAESGKVLPQPTAETAAKIEEEEDPLRARVRILVDSFLQQTWNNAQQNIAVNGIDAEPASFSRLPNCTNPMQSSTDATSFPPEKHEEREGVHFTYAAFDPKLQRKLASLHGELETLTAQVSKLRKTAPQKGAAGYQEKLEENLKQDEEDWTSRHQQSGASLDNILRLETVPDGWNDDVREVFGRGVDELATLSGVGRKEGVSLDTQMSGASLTETVGKAQRARTVAMDFE